MSLHTPSAKRNLPRHVAIIMDGNGRWAEERALPRVAGHKEGAKSVRDVVRAAREIGISAITLYAFSAQNWDRPAEEVSALMELLRDYLLEERSEILENQIRLNAIGHLQRLPELVRGPLAELMEESKPNKEMVLTLALSYGGRESIVKAVQALCAAQEGGIASGAISIDRINKELPTSELPPLDLMIRTSGERRLSNFLLWEAAYAELYFTDVMWPDFRREHLYEALDSYAGRQRRYGRLEARVKGANASLAETNKMTAKGNQPYQ